MARAQITAARLGVHPLPRLQAWQVGRARPMLRLHVPPQILASVARGWDGTGAWDGAPPPPAPCVLLRWSREAGGHTTPQAQARSGGPLLHLPLVPPAGVPQPLPVPVPLPAGLGAAGLQIRQGAPQPSRWCRCRAPRLAVGTVSRPASGATIFLLLAGWVLRAILLLQTHLPQRSSCPLFPSRPSCSSYSPSLCRSPGYPR